MHKKQKTPNFLIVGAQKSGTTSLWHYLKQHPDVFMAEIKEPLFLAYPYYRDLNPKDPRFKLINNSLAKTLDEYFKLFSTVNNEKAIGEASVPYLYHYDLAIPAIKKHIGDCKIIIVLRNPTHRAFSAYTFLLREMDESESFERCLALEKERMKDHWSMIHFYKGAGLYSSQVKAYLSHFKEVKIYFFEELKNSPLETIKELYSFLGVDPQFIPDIKTKHNVSGVPKNLFIHKYITEPNSFKEFLRPMLHRFISEAKRRKLVEGVRRRNLIKPEMNPETRQKLVSYFRNDILRLQDLTQKDLSLWLK